MISHPDINSLSNWQLLPIPAWLRRSGPKAAGSRSIQKQFYYNIFPFLCKPRWYIVRIMHRWWGHNKVTMRVAWQMIRERMGKMQAVQEIINVFAASVVSLAVLFILTRLGGKRQIAQMNLFDYVNSITIGSIAAEMATNLEQWYRPLTAMIVYGIAAFAVHYGTCKNRNVRLWLSGQAIPLMENGTIYKAELDRAKIDLNEFLAQARVAGYFDLNEVQCAMLETSGQISFLPKSFNRPVTPQDLAIQTDPASKWYDLVLDGKLIEENLHTSGKDRTWLNTQLSRAGIGQLSETFYAACDNQDNFFACRGE